MVVNKDKKEYLISDLFVTKHHTVSERDRNVLDWTINWFQENLESLEDYTPQYPECCDDFRPNPYVGMGCIVISDSCRLPKGTRCQVIHYISDELSDKNFYIRNLESDYCCWASAGDLRFLDD